MNDILTPEETALFMQVTDPSSLDGWPVWAMREIITNPVVLNAARQGRRVIGMTVFSDGPVCSACRMPANLIAMGPRERPYIVSEPLTCTCGVRKFIYSDEVA